MFDTVLLDVKIKEIDNVPDPNSIDKVANDAAADQGEGYLAQRTVIEMSPAKKQNHQRHHRDARQQVIVVLKQTPRRPRIPPMHKLEESLNDDLLLGIAQEAEDDLLRQLVQCH